MENPDQFFTTYDLNLSSTLVCLDFDLQKIEKTNSSKGLFCFKKQAGLLETIDQYYKNKLLVSPKDLFNSLKAIKNRLYSNWREK